MGKQPSLKLKSAKTMCASNQSKTGAACRGPFAQIDWVNVESWKTDHWHAKHCGVTGVHWSGYCIWECSISVATVRSIWKKSIKFKQHVAYIGWIL